MDEAKIQRMRQALSYQTSTSALRALFPELSEDQFFLLYLAAVRMNHEI